MADVFISYKKEERERAAAIAAGLETLFVSTWLDAQLAPGESFSEEIRRELGLCKAQLVCWSKAAMASEWVCGEAEIGRKRGVLVPVFLEPCELHPPFNMLHAEQLQDWNGEAEHRGWQNVLLKIGALVGRPGLAGLGRLVHSKDIVAWKSWHLRYPDDPGSGLAHDCLGQALDSDPITPTRSESGASSTPKAATAEQLRSALEVATFRQLVFRDAVKKFGWNDEKEAQRLELEVAALQNALSEVAAANYRENSAGRISRVAAFRTHFDKQGAVGKAGILAAAVAFGFLLLTAISAVIQITQPESPSHLAETAVEGEVVPTQTPAPLPFDLALLGPATNTNAFNGEFEAIGLEPTWASQFSNEYATLQFLDGAAYDAYEGQREVRARGAQTTYRLGEPLAIVVIRQDCSLANGVTTEFEVHIRSSVSNYLGCAAQRRSDRWPPWNEDGSEFWRFEKRPIDH